MAEKTCSLKRDANDDDRDVAGFVADKARETPPPLLVWADPDPMAVDTQANQGRRMRFPLSRDSSGWPADLPLVEARLFWKDAALHVIAKEGGGCRWARIEEQVGGNGEEVTRQEFKVVALADRARFGLESGAALPGLRAIEYRQRGRLVGWRLIAKEK